MSEGGRCSVDVMADEAGRRSSLGAVKLQGSPAKSQEASPDDHL